MERNIYIKLTGPMGSGKSVIANQIRDALEKIPGVEVKFDKSIPQQASRPQNFEPVVIRMKETVT